MLVSATEAIASGLELRWRCQSRGYCFALANVPATEKAVTLNMRVLLVTLTVLPLAETTAVVFLRKSELSTDKLPLPLAPTAAWKLEKSEWLTATTPLLAERTPCGLGS